MIKGSYLLLVVFCIICGSKCDSQYGSIEQYLEFIRNVATDFKNVITSVNALNTTLDGAIPQIFNESYIDSWVELDTSSKDEIRRTLGRAIHESKYFISTSRSYDFNQLKKVFIDIVLNACKHAHVFEQVKHVVTKIFDIFTNFLMNVKRIPRIEKLFSIILHEMFEIVSSSLGIQEMNSSHNIFKEIFSTEFLEFLQKNIPPRAFECILEAFEGTNIVLCMHAIMGLDMLIIAFEDFIDDIKFEKKDSCRDTECAILSFVDIIHLISISIIKLFNPCIEETGMDAQCQGQKYPPR